MTRVRAKTNNQSVIAIDKVGERSGNKKRPTT